MRPLVISGPSGCGKSTLLKKLFAEFPNAFGFSVSHTTRKPRPGEQEGKDYHFVTREEFQNLISENAFIEYAQFGGNIYGTSFKAVHNVQQQQQQPSLQKICILDIERQGVESVKKTNLNAYFLYIKPPSIEILVERLRSRGTESEESIMKRMESVVEDMKYADIEGSYEKTIINDDLEVAYEELREFVKSKYPHLKQQQP